VLLLLVPVLQRWLSTRLAVLTAQLLWALQAELSLTQGLLARALRAARLLPRARSSSKLALLQQQ
jgi:hypothetical protein